VTDHQVEALIQMGWVILYVVFWFFTIEPDNDV
jgi:hypothetical protein